MARKKAPGAAAAEAETAAKPLHPAAPEAVGGAARPPAVPAAKAAVMAAAPAAKAAAAPAAPAPDLAASDPPAPAPAAATAPAAWAPPEFKSRGWFGHYLNENALLAIASYEYRSGEYTWLDGKMNVFWEALVRAVPRKMAANTLTLLGLLSSLLAFLPMAYFAPHWAEPAPRAAYAAVAAATFAYQTFDALDGKHARRTGSSSPLGTLFDHGCDIITATILTSAVIAVARPGHGVATFLVFVVSAHLTQFLYLWWEYHFGVFVSNPGYAGGVTEAQFIVILAALCCAIFGADFFRYDLARLWGGGLAGALFGTKAAPPLRLNTVLVWAIALNNIFAAAKLIRAGLATLPPGRQKRKAASQVTNFLLFMAAEWFLYSAARQWGLHPVATQLLLLTAYAIVCIRLLLSSTGKRYFHTVQWPVIPFFALAWVLGGAALVGAEAQGGLSRCFHVLAYVVLLWQSVYLYDLVMTAIADICTRLEVSCFRNMQPKRASTPAGAPAPLPAGAAAAATAGSGAWRAAVNTFRNRKRSS